MSRLSRFLLGGVVTAVSLSIIFLLLIYPTATSAQEVEPTATPDRLAQPPTVEAPTQADEGEQVYWLHCQPCHGDVGQGFTEAEDDDWRSQYPPGEQNCWESGCHGERPYEEGFTIPTRVPAIIGEGTLDRFYSTAQLHAYIKGAMPYQWPGTLQDAEYLQLTAFLARSYGAWNGITLTTTNLSDFVMNPDLIVQPTETAVSANILATPSPIPTNAPQPTYNLYLIGAGILIVFLIIGGATWHRRR